MVGEAFEALIGRSPAFEHVLRSARVVAATDVTVLLLGETGTGKELLAHAIRKGSPRAEKPFIVLNCAALPESLAESELFGHLKGAFTGAIANKPGKLQAACGGTLFLDEIDSLPLSIQAKLLRFLESGEIQPIGATRTEKVDVRIIAASNQDLEKKVQAGTFRLDLYYRLNIVPLKLPPLRERLEDIPLLADHFARQAAEQFGLEPVTFSKSALKVLQRYHWPGNVRELKNLCQRLTILLAGQTITPENLPEEIKAPKTKTQESLFQLPPEGVSLEAVEKALIEQALARTGGNRTRSAKLLGISRDTLLYRMQKYGLR